MTLFLEVVARKWDEDGEFVNAENVNRTLKRRDVYMMESIPSPQGTIEQPFLWHTECPVAQVKRLTQWAESLSIPVVYDPPGNMADGWNWEKHYESQKPRLPALESTLGEGGTF